MEAPVALYAVAATLGARKGELIGLNVAVIWALAVVEVEPDYLKFDVSLVRDIDRSLIKRSLLETLVDLAERIGARVVAEGIEAESELLALRDRGVGLGQGRYLAPPRPVPEEDAPRT